MFNEHNLTIRRRDLYLLKLLLSLVLFKSSWDDKTVLCKEIEHGQKGKLQGVKTLPPLNKT